MPNPYNGDLTALGLPTALAIQSSTNTTPIQVTTTTNHGLMTHDCVWIYDHTTNTGVNGEWTVTVIDADTFSLDGSTGVAAGGATGTVQPLTFNPAGTNLISDGTDDLDAGNLNPPHEHLLDRTALLTAFLKPLFIGQGIVRPAGLLFSTDKTMTQIGTASMNNTEVAISGSKGTLTKLAENQMVLFAYNVNLAGTGSAQVALGFVSYAPGATPGAYTSLSWKAVDATIRGYTLADLTLFTGLPGGNMDIALIAYSPGIGTAAFYGTYSLYAFVIGG